MTTIPRPVVGARRPLGVALIASSDHPVAEPFAGGLEAHVWTLARGLAARGHRVTLFAGPGSDPGLGADLLEVHELDVVPAARADVSMPDERWLRTHHAYLGLMLELAGRHDVDVVHNHSLHHLPVAMAPVLAAPLVTTLHTPPTPWLQSALDLTGRPGHLVAVSEHTAQAWRCVTPAVEVLRNGVDVSRWTAGPGGDRLVWSGRITAEKAPHLAIEAAADAGMPLDLAGPISSPAYFDAEIAPRLGEDARYVGHLRQPALNELVGRAAAALVTPEWDEPFGLVVAEALACGTPVAAFDRGGIAEVVDDTCGRLARPGDAVDLGRAAREAVTLSRAAARRRAETGLSTRTMVREHEELYDRLVGHVTGHAA